MRTGGEGFGRILENSVETICIKNTTSLKSLRLRDLLTSGYLWFLGLTGPGLGLTRLYWASLGLTGRLGPTLAESN